MVGKESLIEFPCDFQIKVIGQNEDDFITDVVRITRNHAPNTEDHHFQTQLSEKNNYVSITVTVVATDQEMLDKLYIDLSGHPKSKMVL